MSIFDDAVRQARTNRPTYINRRMKVSGYVDPATGETRDDPTQGARAGYMWVHGYPRGANTQVIAGTGLNPYLKDQRVWVGENTSGETVAFEPVIDQNAIAQFGSVIAALNQPSGADELLPRSILGLGFTPGRVEASQLGGLYLHVRDFWYQGTFYHGDELDPAEGLPTLNDFDISGDITAASGESQWVIVYFDPDVGAPQVVVNDPIFGEPSSLYETVIDTSLVPNGVYLLGAVAVSGDQTEIVGTSTFADPRDHLAPKGTTDADWNRIMTDADYNVMVDADGNVMVSS